MKDLSLNGAFRFSPRVLDFSRSRLIQAAAFAFGALTLVVLLVAYYPLIISGPGESHSLFLLEHGATSSLWRFWEIPMAEGPRLVMYYSFVLQYAVMGANAFSYFLVNVLLLWAAGMFVALFAFRLTANVWVAFLSALIFLIYDALYNTIEWLPARQEPMVIIFGLGALLIVMRENTRFDLGSMAAVLALFLLSVFSKEYGMVFMAGAFWYALTVRRDLLLRVGGVCFLVGFIFLAVRFGLAQGFYTNNLQCDDMGYFHEVRRICTTTDLTDVDNLRQLLWNMGVGLGAQIIPHIRVDHSVIFTPLGNAGNLNFEPMRGSDWLAAAVFVLLFVVAIIRRMPGLGICLIIIVANTFLSAPYFRPRNVMFGFSASAIIMAYGAIGITQWLASIGQSWGARDARNGLAAITLAVYVAFVFVPDVRVARAYSEIDLARKATKDHVCEQTGIALRRNRETDDLGNVEVAKEILKANGVYFECTLFRKPPA